MNFREIPARQPLNKQKRSDWFVPPVCMTQPESDHKHDYAGCGYMIVPMHYGESRSCINT